MTGILVFFHCESNTGYAIRAASCTTFAMMANRLVGDWRHVHYGYPSLIRGRSTNLPSGVRNIIEFDASSSQSDKAARIRDYVRDHDIRLAFGFDQPVRRPMFRHLRSAGVRYVVSYWGAPMSSLNSGLTLVLKRLSVTLASDKPDHFIFQSEGMRKTAVYGRGIDYASTSVVRSGVDIEEFQPSAVQSTYVHDIFGIDSSRKVIYYSGHMEERKGVHIIVKAASHLVNVLGRRDVHFVLLGNKSGEETKFDTLYKSTEAENFVTFGGYRSDVDRILPACYAGVIATTGWDSHTMSGLLRSLHAVFRSIVSDIEGLRETLTENTGIRFPIGDYEALAHAIARLVDDTEMHQESTRPSGSPANRAGLHAATSNRGFRGSGAKGGWLCIRALRIARTYV